MSVNPNRYRTMLLLEQVSAMFHVLTVTGNVKNIDRFDASEFADDGISVSFNHKVHDPSHPGQQGHHSVAITIGDFQHDNCNHALVFEQRYNYGVRRDIVVKHIKTPQAVQTRGQETMLASSAGEISPMYIAGLDRVTGEWLLDCVEESLGYMGDSIAYNLCVAEASKTSEMITARGMR